MMLYLRNSLHNHYTLAYEILTFDLSPRAYRPRKLQVGLLQDRRNHKNVHDGYHHHIPWRILLLSRLQRRPI